MGRTIYTHKINKQIHGYNINSLISFVYIILTCVGLNAELTLAISTVALKTYNFIILLFLVNEQNKRIRFQKYSEQN